MAYTDFPPQNQLQFNLNVPLKAKNLAVQHHRVQPVVIQKVKDHFMGPPSVLHQNDSFKFKSINEDRMAMAIQMARRDLKNKKLSEKNGMRSRSPSPKSSKTRVIHSKEYLDRQRRWQQKGKKPISVREHDKNRHPRTVKTQTPQTPKPNFNTAISRLPATTNSPPTRDTDMYPRHKVREDLQPSDDIERLQLEMEGYLEQIKTVEEKAIQDPDVFVHRSRSRKKDGYLSDEEDVERRVTRTEEFATRAARNLYNLRQQVRQIQREILSFGQDSKIRPTKKSQAMSKIAAAHRGAARAIQAFVTNLPHQDLRSGLPSSYQELSLLIRQLTQLSSQIKQGEDSQVQRELTKMLDSVDELSEAWQRELRQRMSRKRESPPRKRSPVNHQLFDQNIESRVKHFKGSTRGPNKENRPRGVLKKSQKHSTRPATSHVQTRPVSQSPERQAALREGIAALMRDRDTQLDRHPQPQKPGVSWNIALDKHPHERKGLLLPAKLQAKREKMHMSHPQVVSDSHFADPTIAANLKAILPLHNPVLDESMSAPTSPHRRSVSHSPCRLGSRHPWRPPGTPTSPGTPKHRSRSLSPPQGRMHFFEEDVDKDIVKQLFPDKEGTFFQHPAHQQFHQSRKSKSVPSPKRRKSPKPARRRDPLRNSFVSSVVEEAKKRIRPCLKKGAASYPGYNPSRRSSPSPDRSSLRDESISSQFLDDILAETVRDLQESEQGETIHKKAASMRDAPTLETIMQRLEEMEVEQHTIRQRWATVTYANPKPVSKFLSTKEVMSERPRSPPAIEVSRRREEPTRHVQVSHQRTEEPILFTKEVSASKYKASYSHPSTAQREDHQPVTLRTVPRPRTMLSLPQSAASRISNSQETYSSYLKKMSHHPHGVFQPWKLVEQISDEILQECMEEVTGELDDLNDVIANHLYKSEFMEARSQSESPDGRESEQRGGAVESRVDSQGRNLDYQSSRENLQKSRLDKAHTSENYFADVVTSRSEAISHRSEVVTPLSDAGNVRSDVMSPRSEVVTPRSAVVSQRSGGMSPVLVGVSPHLSALSDDKDEVGSDDWETDDDDDDDI